MAITGRWFLESEDGFKPIKLGITEDNKIDWTTFKLRIQIDSSMETVYKAWATSGKLKEWFLEKASFESAIGKDRRADELCKKDDSYTWKWHNWEFEESGKILEANGKDSLSFVFGAGGKVSVTLKKIGGQTEIWLTQYDIPTDETSKMNYFIGCKTGWTFWLTNLKAWLEHNITLNAVNLTQSETKYLVNS